MFLFCKPAFYQYATLDSWQFVLSLVYLNPKRFTSPTSAKSNFNAEYLVNFSLFLPIGIDE